MKKDTIYCVETADEVYSFHRTEDARDRMCGRLNSKGETYQLYEMTLDEFVVRFDCMPMFWRE